MGNKRDYAGCLTKGVNFFLA